MLKIAIRLMLAGATFAGATCFEVPASYAYGDAPWCAVIELGPGDVYWDCQYRTFEACAPNVLAGNRGFCNVNPAASPATAGNTPRPRYRRHHPLHHHTKHQ